ncbi:MAG: DUF2834 domain-containing protein [Gammaproteobacteria bacterium]|nr:DUF2834 domain-containing protein [Gammaproteobacteria bacterium]
MSKSSLARTFLVLAIAGAVIPYVFFLDWFAAEGLSLPGFVGGAFVNGAAGGFTADVLVSSLVFWIYLLSRKTPGFWLYVAVNLLIGLSCALPLYLYRITREAALKEARAA